MEVRITGRHGDTPDEVREYAHDKLSPLGKFNRHTRSLEVVLDEDHLSKTVEVIAHLERGAPVVVHAKHADARAAIDLAHDKLEKVLRRHKERIEDRRRDRTAQGGVVLGGAGSSESGSSESGSSGAGSSESGGGGEEE